MFRPVEGYIIKVRVKLFVDNLFKIEIETEFSEARVFIMKETTLVFVTDTHE